jgi:type II secretory pathway component GspD/PulD (secretin)
MITLPSEVEDFVKKYIDISLDKEFIPVFTYKLEYTDSTNISNILNQIVKYGSATDPSGVSRSGNFRYFQNMNISSDTVSNSLIINCFKEDYLELEKIIKKLDVPQKQIALELLIVKVKDNLSKSLGSQLSDPTKTTFFQDVTFQTSGIPPGSNFVGRIASQPLRCG